MTWVDRLEAWGVHSEIHRETQRLCLRASVPPWKALDYLNRLCRIGNCAITYLRPTVTSGSSNWLVEYNDADSRIFTDAMKAFGPKT